MLCWKLGEPRSGAVLLAEVADAVLMVVLHRLAVPLGHAFGGLVTRMLSDSDRFFTWCITPGTQQHQCSDQRLFTLFLFTFLRLPLRKL